MRRPEKRELRVYRLAALLTGSPDGAIQVMESVLKAQPDVRKVDDAHLDRLTVLRSRESVYGQLVDELVSTEVTSLLAAMTPQQREAWVFSHVLQRPARSIARAMDCSVTATQRHLARADELATQHLGDVATEAAAALRRYIESLRLPEFYIAHRARRQRARHLLIAAALLLAAIGAILFSLWFNRQ